MCFAVPFFEVRDTVMCCLACAFLAERDPVRIHFGEMEDSLLCCFKRYGMGMWVEENKMSKKEAKS